MDIIDKIISEGLIKNKTIPSKKEIESYSDLELVELQKKIVLLIPEF
jgi:hypothetical protein